MEKIKSLTQTKCPHCNKDILVEAENTPPIIIGVITIDQIMEAKNKVLIAVGDMGLGKDEVHKITDWIKNDDLIFGPNEVADVINEIKKQHDIIEKPTTE